ncbi:hypothetical protein D1AOALGA4SA_5479 [Olavius algarvensis Delta 1 endosymbiont]|nr:hypothetical protein D1AOALGA4SA_5479 [Olavius algarvensis Delta 1 endosymbiont]
MIDPIVSFITRHAGKERLVSVRLLSLIAGVLVFLVALPMALGRIGQWVAGHVSIGMNRTVELILASSAIVTGLLFLLWSISVFWSVGRGTPVPLASPTRLVTNGPFKYTRNPIKLGAVLFYLGTGTLYEGIVTGLVMLLIGAVLGTLYHKGIEEKELALRFGAEYEEYRRRTSFFIPWPPKK